MNCQHFLTVPKKVIDLFVEPDRDVRIGSPAKSAGEFFCFFFTDARRWARFQARKKLKKKDFKMTHTETTPQDWQLTDKEIEDLENNILSRQNLEIYEGHKDRYNRLKTFNKDVSDKVTYVTITIKDVWNWNPTAS